MRNIYKTIPKQRLKELYSNQGLSFRDIAKKYHCDLGVIARALQHHKIAVRHPTQALKLNAHELKKLYQDKKLSIYKIGDKYGCDPKTIYRYLKLNKIATRSRKRILLSRTMLTKMYLKEGKSLKTIAHKYGYSPAGILKKLRQFDIQRRSTSEMNIKHARKDFDGELRERAYLIGFRLGDLGVRKIGKFVHISSGTTKSAQRELIVGLLSPYGPVWVSKRDSNGARNISSSVNRSFLFLLPKHTHIPRWILRSNSSFFSFLAGYTDAEGNIYISDERAKFRLRACDKGILRDIHIGLRHRGIENLFGLDRKAGINSNGAKLNRDFWFVTVNERHALSRLFMILLPLLRHQKRRRDAEEAAANLTRRLAQ